MTESKVQVMQPTRKQQLCWIGGVLLVTFLLDQISKALIIHYIAQDAPYRGDVFFHFTHQRNTGLIGGAFGDIAWVAKIMPLFALGILIYLFRQLNKDSRVHSVAYGMIMGGALGNILDRIRLGWVTDFFQFHFYFIPFDFPWKYYPSFNIADAGIMIGIFTLLFTLKPEAESKPEQAHVSDNT